ncbi:hypothetical protein M8C17_20815 [Micromonospora sp. RHAY321]|uniref:hypothetical protein n=1 Tax=unclassified Micromonospora TaxID=2617518 RepID=UPI00207CFCC8|nr:hypothetical protein [Micromonospora sp. RHAY321]MCO1597598.1 hypothetical protein [Micromonospora sp. RHAY321]
MTVEIVGATGGVEPDLVPLLANAKERVIPTATTVGGGILRAVGAGRETIGYVSNRGTPACA